MGNDEMKMYFLRFDNEAEAKTALADYMQEGEFITASVTHALDVVGVIYSPTGVMLTDEDGNISPEMAPIAGYHINMALNELPDALAAYQVIPTTPSRVFAGLEAS